MNKEPMFKVGDRVNKNGRKAQVIKVYHGIKNHQGDALVFYDLKFDGFEHISVSHLEIFLEKEK